MSYEMHFSTFSVIISKKKSYLKSYVDLGSTSSQKMMLKASQEMMLKASFPQVPDCGSMKPSSL